MLQLWVAVAVWAVSIACPAQVIPGLPKHSPVPGGVAIVKLGDATAPPVLDVRYEGRRVALVRSADAVYGVIGIALDAKPGMQRLHAAAGQGTVQLLFETGFEVKPKTYPVQHLTISERFLKLSEADQQRAEREAVLISAAQEHWSAEPPASYMLDPPAKGRRSSNFGQGRVLNGVPSVPHAGIDIAINTGTPIVAAAPGKVINAGDYFYAGKSVFVDHGQGFITLYIHLSRIDVKEGDVLARGQQLGLSGATGRVTGPHLHSGVLLNGVYVDPELFFQR